MNVNNLTHRIIGFAFKIHNTLGAGFIESVYENALKIELNKIGISALQQQELDVFLRGSGSRALQARSLDSQDPDH